MFNSQFLTLPASGRKIHYVESQPEVNSNVMPIVAVHGLGGTASYWLPAIYASGLAKTRRIVAYDFDGHGLSDFSGRLDLSIDDLVSDLEDILSVLGLSRIVLMGHSMNGIVTSLFAERHPKIVEKLILVHPVRNLPPAACDNMRKRAALAATLSGLSQVANTVASTAVSKVCQETNPTVKAFIRHMVASTNPKAYAAACLALATAPHIDPKNLEVALSIIGGEEDYLCGPEAVQSWATAVPEGRGESVILKNVGHWGATEAPEQVAEALLGFLSQSTYFILLGTFRSPYLFTLTFSVKSRQLKLVHTSKATGGHSWLDVSPNGKSLYTTAWTTPPTVASYDIVPATQSIPYPTPKLQSSIPSTHLSGYVCSNSKAMYSACGPQIDVFLVDKETGSLLQQPAVQSFSLVAEQDRHKGMSQMDFGGLRHGGHSCDLSPDGTKLYVADIGRNCVWLYHVDTTTGLLTEGSKNIAKRLHDGPRHAWPHPNGTIVYSLQEHSSYIDVLQLSPDGSKLEWLEGCNILPEDGDCKLFWADEVRLSPNADTLFGSTRGLEAHTKGYVAAWPLSPDGRLAAPAKDALHRFTTRTSGGWANAIAVCPEHGPAGESYLTLTDSEQGFIQVLQYHAKDGFKVVDEVKLGSDNEHVGASVAVWL